MATINPVAEVFSYKRGRDILWLKDKRKAYTGAFQSEFKAGTLEEIADKSASEKPQASKYTCWGMKVWGQMGYSDVFHSQCGHSRSASLPCAVVSKGNETMGFLGRQGCTRQIIPASTVLSDFHMLLVFMQDSMKLVVGFRSQKHGAGFSKTIQYKTNNKGPLQLFFSVNVCSGSLG